MEIKVLGTGCAKCQSLEQITREAIERLQINASLEKVSDPLEIITYNARRTPALVINGKVVLSGILPSPNDLDTIIRDSMLLK